MSTTTIVPIAATSVGSVNTSAGTAPYVDTSDGDSSWVQTDPASPSGGTWDLQLPATTVCESPTAMRLVIEGRYVSGTGPTSDPADDPSAPAAYLRRSYDGGSSFSVMTLSQSVGLDNSLTYTADVLTQEPNSGFGVTLETIATELAAGNMWITVVNQYGAPDKHAFRVTYAALLVDCAAVPPLRQNQRDDVRQNQHTSRQLTVRQRGYL